jgi:tRNA(fMet)-specific endonuclease VapC
LKPFTNLNLCHLIAAHALAIGAMLVTNNTKHFGRISTHAPLILENWLQ